MAYASSVWLASVAAICPSQDTAGDGTTTLTDFAAGANGTLTNMDSSTDWVTDDSKRCLDFDGTNDYVINDCCPIGGAKKLSIAAKFRRLATTGSGVFLCVANVLAGTTANRLLVYHFSDGNLYVQFDGANYGYFAQSLTDLGWHSLIVLFDGTATGNSNRLKVWVDGTAKTLTFVGTVPSQLTTITAGRLVLGAICDTSTLYGRSRMDDVRVSVRLFSDSERAEIDASRGGTYAAASGGGTSQLINGGLVRGQVL